VLLAEGAAHWRPDGRRHAKRGGPRRLRGTIRWWDCIDAIGSAVLIESDEHDGGALAWREVFLRRRTDRRPGPLRRRGLLRFGRFGSGPPDLAIRAAMILDSPAISATMMGTRASLLATAIEHTPA